MAMEPYFTEMRAGWECLRERSYKAARAHFWTAHDLGHDRPERHMDTHRALLTVALKQWNPLAIGVQLWLLANVSRPGKS